MTIQEPTPDELDRVAEKQTNKRFVRFLGICAAVLVVIPAVLVGVGYVVGLPDGASFTELAGLGVRTAVGVVVLVGVVGMGSRRGRTWWGLPAGFGEGDERERAVNGRAASTVLATMTAGLVVHSMLFDYDGTLYFALGGQIVYMVLAIAGNRQT